MIFSIITASEFEAFAKDTPNASYLQSQQFSEHRANIGWQAYFVAVKIDQDIQLAAYLAVTGRYGDIYGGPIGDIANSEALACFVQGLKKLAKQLKLMQVTLNPTDTRVNLISEFEKYGLKQSQTEIIPHFVTIKSLEGIDSAKNLLNQLPKTSKYAIKNALKYNLSTRSLTADELPIFVDLLEETADKQGFETRDLAFYQSLLTHMNHGRYTSDYQVVELDVDQLRVQLTQAIANYQAQLDKTTKPGKQKQLLDEQNASKKRLSELDGLSGTIALGAGYFITDEREEVFLFAGNADPYKRFLGSYYLQYARMSRLIEQQTPPIYNFYGIKNPELAADDSVYQFKKHFDVEVVTYFPQLILVTQPLRYHLKSLIKRMIG